MRSRRVIQDSIPPLNTKGGAPEKQLQIPRPLQGFQGARAPRGLVMTALA